MWITLFIKLLSPAWETKQVSLKAMFFVCILYGLPFATRGDEKKRCEPVVRELDKAHVML